MPDFVFVIIKSKPIIEYQINLCCLSSGKKYRVDYEKINIMFFFIIQRSERAHTIQSEEDNQHLIGFLHIYNYNKHFGKIHEFDDSLIHLQDVKY